MADTVWLWRLSAHWHMYKMEIAVRLFPYGKTMAGLRQVCEQSRLFKDSTAARVQRKAADVLPHSPTMEAHTGGGCGCFPTGDSCSLFQTQAAQTVLQSREAPVMPRMAVLLGLMGIGVSGYSSRQLTLHCKPSSRLFRWSRRRKKRQIWPNFQYILHTNLHIRFFSERVKGHLVKSVSFKLSDC